MPIRRIKSKKYARRLRIRRSIRRKVMGTAERPRMSVFRSNTALYVQIIDDEKAHTLLAASTRELDAEAKSVNIDRAKQLGELIAKKSQEAGIGKVVFDRGGYLYHGRIKALAEAARSAGLNF